MSDKIDPLGVIRYLLGARSNQNFERESMVVVLLGGSALSVHNVRESNNDIDLYCSDGMELPAPSVMASLVSRGESNEGFGVDSTDDTHLWGQVNVADIESDSGVVGQFNVDGLQVIVRALSLETLFILKTDAGRDKDLLDVALIASHITPMKIVTRLNSLMKCNDSSFMTHLVATTLSEISLQYMHLDQETLLPKLIAKLDLDYSQKELLAANFGVSNIIINEEGSLLFDRDCSSP